MMDSEQQIAERVAAYLSGNATPEEIKSLALWVQQSETNYRYYEQLYRLWQIEHPSFDFSDADVEQARKKILEKIAVRPWYQIAFRYWSSVAAILILPVLFCSLYFFYDFNKAQSDVIYQEIKVPFGSSSRISLPDGSMVCLNAGSSLKFPTVIKEGERRVFLNGEAFFEVVSDTESPFIVETEYLQVKATGTKFNVEAYEKEPVAVTLGEGKLNLTSGKQGDDVFMTPGDRVLFDPVSSSFAITKTDADKWCAWKDGRLVFRDDSLSYIFNKIGKTFNVNFNIEDAELGKQPYRVTFENESLSVILDLMKQVAPIEYEMNKKYNSSDSLYVKSSINIYPVERK